MTPVRTRVNMPSIMFWLPELTRETTAHTYRVPCDVARHRGGPLHPCPTAAEKHG